MEHAAKARPAGAPLHGMPPRPATFMVRYNGGHQSDQNAFHASFMCGNQGDEEAFEAANTTAALVTGPGSSPIIAASGGTAILLCFGLQVV